MARGWVKSQIHFRSRRTRRKKVKSKVTQQSKRANVRIVVPWITKREWQNVKQKIFSSAIQDNIEAINRIAAWKNRCHSKIPLGIEVTDALLRAHVKDCDAENSQIVVGDLVMMYSAAIVRFINLVSEMGQKGVINTPIHIIATRMNVPQWLVDLRHDAAHSRLPPLITLQNGYSAAMGWIEKNYWNEEEKSMLDPELCSIEKDAQISENTTTQFKSWDLAPLGTDWQKYPLGLLPYQLENFPNVDLTLPTEVDQLYLHRGPVPQANVLQERNEWKYDEEPDREEFDLDFDEFSPNLEDRPHIDKFTRVPHIWTEEQMENILNNLTIFTK